MKFSQVSSAVMLATLPISGVFAAALDRSGQPMNAFFQDGNYFEAGISVLDPTVSGKEVRNTKEDNGTTENRTINDMGEDYYFPNAAIKLQPHEKFSVAVIYDHPFGANAEYKGNNKFVYNATEQQTATTAKAEDLITKEIQAQVQNRVDEAQKAGTPLTQPQIKDITNAVTPVVTAAVQTRLGQVATISAKTPNPNSTANTTVDVETENLSLVLGYQPTKNWNIYAGSAYQTVKANISLRGTAYSVFNGYDVYAPKTDGLGWLAGVAYSKPEIALRASVTYRSEIDHDIDDLKENFTNLKTTAKSRVTTPQSVNLDLQSGIAPDTLAFLNVRWVDWSNFKFQPNQFGQLSRIVGPQVGKPNGFNLVQYSKDQISANLGVGRKFSDRWSASASVGWDSGAGNPVTTLGPTKGYWNAGLGAQYSPAKNYFISGGVKYFWLGDAKAQSGARAGTEDFIGEFKDNKAIAYGLKIGYRF